MELRPLGVHVLLLAIGMVRSNISANVEAAHDFRPAGSYYDAYRRNIDARLGQGDDVMPADLFARKTVDAALAPAPPRYMSFGGQVGLFNRVFAWLPRSVRLDLAWKAYSAAEPKV
jgi:1-acylglycerone phosphate reductase